jgi:hypothetical protein
MTPKLGKAELQFFALHFYFMRSIYQQSFMLISLTVLELCPEQSAKYKMWTKGKKLQN